MKQIASLALADAALPDILPGNISPAQGRCALTAVIKRQLAQPRTFAPDGWLRTLTQKALCW